ncbi:MAG: isoprenylcysteine carboxylmethyltransferase family protein [Vicinamibacteria bacterium]
MSLSRSRVRSGYVAGALALFFAQPDHDSLVAGGSLALAGQLIRIWASGHIEKTLKLATGGPYAHTRNPLYVGSVLMALGLLAAAQHPISVLAGLLYLGVFYPYIIREEAKFLRGKFPDEYSAWAKAVPIFFPRLTPGGPKQSKFQMSRLRSNHEWRSIIGLGLLSAFMIWRLP